MHVVGEVRRLVRARCTKRLRVADSTVRRLKML